MVIIMQVIIKLVTIFLKVTK